MKDEEYNDLCRITLKKCSRYYAVTCGIYGELVHTAFADDGDMLYSNMKKELQTYLESDMCEDEASEFLNGFATSFECRLPCDHDNRINPYNMTAR